MGLLTELEKIENELDLLNASYGEKESLCIWCKSKKYNGQVGIVHSKNCVMTQIRNKIKELR